MLNFLMVERLPILLRSSKPSGVGYSAGNSEKAPSAFSKMFKKKESNTVSSPTAAYKSAKTETSIIDDTRSIPLKERKI